MTQPVRCPRCRKPSRVGPADLGRLVVCPKCETQFIAAADDPDPVPTVASLGPDPAAVGLALLSWGIPLGWLLAPFVTGRESVFSFAAPVAIAAGLTGLGIGVSAAKWSPATRAKAVLALLLVGYFTGGFLYFLKREWAEAVRNHVGRAPGEWKEFPGEGYQVRLPGRPVEGESPLAGWGLKAFRLEDRSDLFVVAAGPAPGDLPDADEAWFEKAKQAVVAETGRDLRADPVPVATAGKDAAGKPAPAYPGREFVVDLPDQSVRIVRVFRVKDRAIYLAAQGPFWHPGTGDVKKFFDSFRVGK